mgnify:CR=1 FL=1
MTGMSDLGWQAVKDAGAQVSIAFPIEMNMRHGIPPILKMQSLRHGALAERRRRGDDDGGLLHPDALGDDPAARDREPDDPRAGELPPPNQLADARPGTPPLLNVRDVLRFATINGAKALRLDGKTGTLTPGKEADIILLDATRAQRGAAQQRAGRGRLADGHARTSRR